ncbi:MAG: dihydrolipoyl dehydrogenase [Pseudomonadota bacterium]|nr:dihydrolipoyl dehydrogenase [Gammaproteobacteria bacterium]MEE2684562.1 dihydrolipoyl dehydrogenase [Pseudomonadota bacterium]|tara:strand:+ start:1022 stop:2440 length:1419 start_codon:yes stop_codon:yes gene_type:complete
MSNKKMNANLVVLGSGPGGYTAAFRAADLGLDVILIERSSSLGGVCLNVGCIPSKALLHASKVIEESKEMLDKGIDFGKPKIDLSKLRGWKEDVVSKLTSGLSTLANKRNVTVLHGVGKFVSPNEIEVKTGNSLTTVNFKKCIIAAGSEPSKMPNSPSDPRIMDSTGALQMDDIPDRLLVIGGGIIGLEMATVYEALGSKVSIVELTDKLMPTFDRDLIRPLHKMMQKKYEAIMLGTSVTSLDVKKEGISVGFSGNQAPSKKETFDKVLVAIGRTANGLSIGADKAGVITNKKGLIEVDNQQRTNQEHIFAIGDIVGEPMLAHKATHEGKVAAEVVSGMKTFFDARVIPSVAYTDPEVASVGISEDQAKEQGIDYEKGVFPWAASGRSLALGRSEGITKLIIEKNTKKILGAGIVGSNAGDLIVEVGFAIEMDATTEDIGLTIHPHPTLSETIGFAAEVAEGTITDLYIPKR